MKATLIVAIVVVVIVAGAGAYLTLIRPGGETTSPSAPSGFSVVSETTQGSNTVTTYSGTGTTQSAYSAFDAWMSGNGWELRMENGIFAGYQGHLYDKGNETAVVQVTLQAGQVTVVLVRGPRPSGPQENQQPPENQIAPPDLGSYTWKFYSYAVGPDATGAAHDDVQFANMPQIIKLANGTYRMYYGVHFRTPVSGAKSAIKSAVSSDGVNWTVESGYRLLGDSDGDSGPDGVPKNEELISAPDVIQLSDGTYRMYYQAQTDGANPPDFRVKSARSTDGLTWTREGTRIDIEAGSQNPTAFSVAAQTDVIRFSDNDYVILLSANYKKSASQPADLVIGTSTDGLNFSNWRILYTNGHDPGIVKLVSGGYLMFYGDLDKRQRVAFSPDGRTWPDASETAETIQLNGAGTEVKEQHSTENPADRCALEINGEIWLYVNWGWNVGLLKPVRENQPPSPPPENKPGGVQFLENDFQPWSGRGRTQTFPATQRLLLATSDDGLNFTRKNVILSDCATVPDAVVLNNGRVLVYYVAESIIENGVEISSYNKIVVAVSDDNGNTWSYKKVKFNGVPSGATDPVDPNVVLMPDGTIRMFTTIDPAGSQLAHTYSFVSTDNGFTYTLEGERFSVSGQVVLDPEVFRFSDTNWQIWAGNRHATSTDGNNFTDQGIVNLGGEQYPRVIADVTDFSTTTPLYRMYTHSGNPQGGTDIKSLTSTDSNNWVLEGTRLTLDTSTGLESEILFFPTVVRLKNGKYLMVYETTIPA